MQTANLYIRFSGPGYQNERVHYVNAKHRDICKFESKEDPNYVTMKNALASAIADLLEDGRHQRSELCKSQLDKLT